MQKILFDRFERMRSGFRFIFFLGLGILLVPVTVTAAQALLSAVGFDPRTDTVAFRAGAAAASLAAVTLLSWGVGKLLESLPFKALGASFTKGWAKDLIAGLVIGGLAVCVAVGVAALFGGLRFSLNPEIGTGAVLSSAAAAIIVFTFGAAFEEVFARGYIFQTFVRSGLPWLALLLTSGIFASLHFGNPEAGTFSSLNTFFAGLWLGIAYLKTRSLWLAFGLHLAWNFVLGSLFGIEVSGLTDLAAQPVLLESDSGPAWITGGEYGLEGGISCTVALIAATAAVWFAPFLQAEEELRELSSPPPEANGDS